MDCILAIDQGTHASRALLFDHAGRVVARSLAPVTLRRPRPACVEQDPLEILDSVHASVDAVMDSLDARRRAAVTCGGIATQRSTVLAWHRNGAPASAALNWQDTRGQPRIDALKAHATSIHRLSGLPLSAHYGASKLHWLQQLLASEPGLQFGPLVSFLLQALLQEAQAATDHSNAQRMQLFDIRRLEWSPQLADWFEVELERLPPCRPLSHRYGTLAGHDVPLTAAAGDQNAAWFANGRPPDDCAHINIGSGAFVMAQRPADGSVDGLISSIAWSDARHCDYLVEGTVNGAGNALEWLRQKYAIEQLPQRLPAWLEAIDEPPLFVNTVGGLGSPFWCRGPEPAFHNQGKPPDDAARAVAVVESILFLLQYNLERIQARRPLTRLRIGGGLSRLDALCRKLASLSGLPVERGDEREASARGIAWLAAGRPDGWEENTVFERFLPHPDTSLQARYRRFLDLLQHRLGEGHD
ncbi:MAG TPA: hypothetical protein ENK05_01850 [Gammaproteobacteria bacterium]|nr:hypothetical protein [Gammaproteobacteria bacterium]